MDFGEPVREMLKWRVPRDMRTPTFLVAHSEPSVYSLAGDVASVLPPERWDLCLKVVEK